MGHKGNAYSFAFVVVALMEEKEILPATIIGTFVPISTQTKLFIFYIPLCR
jgi:hypothetical protein